MDQNKENSSRNNLFIISIIAGFVFWAIFGTPNLEPWDTIFEWIIIISLGGCFGFIGKRSPWLWGLGIYIGEVIYGVGTMFFGPGVGANLFIPVGMIFLLVYTFPALLGSFIGYGIRIAIRRYIG